MTSIPSDPETVGVGQKGLAIALYVCATIGLAVCLLAVYIIWRSYHPGPAIGYFTPAAVGSSILLAGFLPGTLLALLWGVWLWPPPDVTEWIRSRKSKEPGPPSVPTPRAILILIRVLRLGGITILALSLFLLASMLQSGYVIHGPRGPVQMRLAVLSLLLLSPLFLQSALLFWISVRLSRTRP